MMIVRFLHVIVIYSFMAILIYSCMIIVIYNRRKMIIIMCAIITTNVPYVTIHYLPLSQPNSL